MEFHHCSDGFKMPESRFEGMHLAPLSCLSWRPLLRAWRFNGGQSYWDIRLFGVIRWRFYDRPRRRALS